MGLFSTCGAKTVPIVAAPFFWGGGQQAGLSLNCHELGATDARATRLVSCHRRTVFAGAVTGAITLAKADAGMKKAANSRGVKAFPHIFANLPELLVQAQRS